MDLAEHPFFAGFPTTEARRLQSAAAISSLPASTILFPEGAPSDCLYLVLEGEVILMKAGGDRTLDIATAGEGDFFGELGLLDESPRSTGARVDRPATLARIDKSSFLDALSGAPADTLRMLVGRISNQLRKTNDRLLDERIRKEKMTLVGEMANTIIHDIRSPFSVVTLASDLIARKHADSETKHFCGMIDKQIRNATGMVEEILEFSRGTSRLNLAPVRVEDLFAAFYEVNHLTLEEKGISLNTRPADAVVRADEPKLLRVLQNLCKNAADAMEKEPGSVTLSAEVRDEQVDLSLADTGPGLPAGIQATLFEPFVTSDKPNGTGLGLSIVKSIVEAHGGEINFTTESGKGTTFRISLPAS